jgi:hypothetical protein
MTRALNDHHVEYEGEHWSLIARPGFEDVYHLAGIENAPWIGDTRGAPRGWTLRVGEDRLVRLVAVTLWGWRLDERGQRILADSPGMVMFDPPRPDGPDWGASMLTIELDQPQRVSGRWIIARGIKPDVQMHSWIPSADDFEEARELVLKNGRVVATNSWAAVQRRQSLVFGAIALVVTALLSSACLFAARLVLS